MQGKGIKKALTPKEVAEIYGLSVGTLNQWRYKKVGPRYFRINTGTGRGRKIIYMIEDIEEFVKRDPVITIGSIPEDRGGF